MLFALWQNVYAQDVLTNAEKSSRAAYFNSLLRVQGSVLDAQGHAVVGCNVLENPNQLEVEFLTQGALHEEVPI